MIHIAPLGRLFCFFTAENAELAGLLGAPPSVVGVVLSVVLGFAGRRRFRL